jgi:sugar transferase (PEP-CTERM system associated)
LIRVFSHWLPSKTVFQIVFDLMLLFFSMVLAAAWLNRDPSSALGVIAPYALVFALATTAVNKAVGFYHRDAKRGLTQTLALALVSFLLAVSVAYGIFGVLPKQGVRYEVLQLSALLALAAMVVVRVYAAHGGLGPVLVRRVMVLGTGSEAIAVEQSLRGGDVNIVGFYPVPGNEASQVPQARVLGADKSLVDAARKLKVDEIIVAVGERRGGGMPLNELLDCKLAGMRVLDLSSYFERALGQVRLDSLRASWLIFGDGFRQGVLRTVVKRLFDIVAASVLIVLALPLMLITAILIALEGGFPVLYQQERVGQGGRIFRVTKFRSMRTDAELDGKPRWAASNDDRVTRVGRVIRRYRIDELPQLFNVLKGDMSLVGPRPERPFFVDQLTREIPFYAARHSIKPGLTGWAQVRYHYGATLDDAAEKLQFDLYYVKNHSLFLDLVILFETVVVVITGEGAQ